MAQMGERERASVCLARDRRCRTVVERTRDHVGDTQTASVDVDRCDQVSSLDTFGKFVLDIRFFSSIIYILYEGGSLRPPVVTRSYDGLM